MSFTTMVGPLPGGVSAPARGFRDPRGQAEEQEDNERQDPERVTMWRPT
jgi:hypothetical protein